MKIPYRPGLVVAVLVAVLVGVTAVAVYSLVLLGSMVLALSVAAGGLAAVAAAAYAVAREAGQVLPPPPASTAPAPLAAPLTTPAALPGQPRRQRVKVREARPGEVPAPYLAAVMKGAQATRAAQKARSGDS